MERNSAEENKTLRGELTAEQCAKFTVLESHYKRAWQNPAGGIRETLAETHGISAITHI